MSLFAKWIMGAVLLGLMVAGGEWWMDQKRAPAELVPRNPRAPDP